MPPIELNWVLVDQSLNYSNLIIHSQLLYDLILGWGIINFHFGLSVTRPGERKYGLIIENGLSPNCGPGSGVLKNFFFVQLEALGSRN